MQSLLSSHATVVSLLDFSVKYDISPAVVIYVTHVSLRLALPLICLCVSPINVQSTNTAPDYYLALNAQIKLKAKL